MFKALLASYVTLTSARLVPQGDAPAPPPATDLPCDAPTARAPVEFADGMIVGGASDFAMHSGYINVTQTDYLFYWLFEARAGARDDAPLVVWSNGGPGCSAMEGATTEHGPYVLYDVKESGAAMFSGKLTKNPFAWNANAHVLYVDQPRYVGYSAGTGSYTTSSQAAGVDMVAFLLGWREPSVDPLSRKKNPNAHPNRQRPRSSSAGDRSRARAPARLPRCRNARVRRAAFPEHARRRIILASESYGGHFAPAWTGALLDHNAAAPAAAQLPLAGVIIGNGITNSSVQNGARFADFAKESGLLAADSKIDTEAGARAAMELELGYSPNFYDYRVKAQTCCGCSSYDYSTWAAWHLRDDVLRALHVCGDAGAKAFGGCAAGCINFPGGFDVADGYEYSRQLERALDMGINVTLYYGKDDTACNYVGGRALAESLQWPGAAAFNAAEFVSHAGFQTKGDIGRGLTFVQVDAASHMVPIQQGAAALFALESLIN